MLKISRAASNWKYSKTKKNIKLSKYHFSKQLKYIETTYCAWRGGKKKLEIRDGNI